MKVAISCNTTWSQGGQGTCLAQAAHGIAKTAPLEVFCSSLNLQSCAKFIITPLGKSRWSKTLSSSPLLRRREDWIVLLSDLYFDGQLKKKIESSCCDLVVGVAGQSYQTFKAAKKQGAIIWLYCLNSYLPFMQAQIQQEISALHDPTVSAVHPLMLRRFLQECRMADLILLLSEVSKQTFMDAGFPEKKLAVATPFIDAQRFRSTPKFDSTFRVVYVGSIEPRKGVHHLIAAFLEANIPRSELLLVGGASTRALRLLLANVMFKYPNIRQEFWDFSHQDPTQVFSRGSVFVLPSVEDGFGLVALEAMACGLPVIVTSHCGAADIVEHGVNGFIVPPRDINAISEKLKFLARNESVRLEMSKAARTTAEQHTQDRYERDIFQVFVNQGLV